MALFRNITDFSQEAVGIEDPGLIIAKELSSSSWEISETEIPPNSYTLVIGPAGYSRKFKWEGTEYTSSTSTTTFWFKNSGGIGGTFPGSTTPSSTYPWSVYIFNNLPELPTFVAGSYSTAGGNVTLEENYDYILIDIISSVTSNSYSDRAPCTYETIPLPGTRNFKFISPEKKGSITLKTKEVLYRIPKFSITKKPGIGDKLIYSNTSSYINTFSYWNINFSENGIKKGKISMSAGGTGWSSVQYTSSTYYSSNYGGKTECTLDFSNLPSLTLYTAYNSPGIAYGELSTYDSLLYYRFLVAGAAGATLNKSRNSAKITTGGGLKGGTGKLYESNGISYDFYEASQNSAGRYSSYSSGNGSFGKGGAHLDDKYGSYGRNHFGGYGWYGGGAYWGYESGNYTGNKGYAGGGSGFIIGSSTTTYPSGYLGGDNALQTEIASYISEPLTEDGTGLCGIRNYAFISIEILEMEGAGTTTSVIYYYTSSEFIPTNPYYFNGTEFILCDAYRYNGTEFVKIE